ncbi:hypothetical protein IQ07DRAFT_602069 [Pyrenochaeta sp. DS3sAY3a]|nr:hypothetical protein IQ07DRAFT_602069 [Pyrenochaeta sp. DS3sAY3a]
MLRSQPLRRILRLLPTIHEYEPDIYLPSGSPAEVSATREARRLMVDEEVQAGPSTASSSSTANPPTTLAEDSTASVQQEEDQAEEDRSEEHQPEEEQPEEEQPEEEQPSQNDMAVATYIPTGTPQDVVSSLTQPKVDDSAQDQSPPTEDSLDVQRTRTNLPTVSEWSEPTTQTTAEHDSEDQPRSTTGKASNCKSNLVSRLKKVKTRLHKRISTTLARPRRKPASTLLSRSSRSTSRFSDSTLVSNTAAAYITADPVPSRSPISSFLQTLFRSNHDTNDYTRPRERATRFLRPDYTRTAPPFNRFPYLSRRWVRSQIRFGHAKMHSRRARPFGVRVLDLRVVDVERTGSWDGRGLSRREIAVKKCCYAAARGEILVRRFGGLVWRKVKESRGWLNEEI